VNPSTFEEALARINPDLRLVWNPRNEVWSIEQRVGRGVFEVPVSFDDPIYARVRDGYALVMEIAPRASIRCTDCRHEFPITPLKFAEYRCPFCKYLGENSQYYVGYFPFCDALLSHLKRLAPERQREAAMARKVGKYENDRSWQRKSDNDLDASLRESHAAIVGIPSKGWSPDTGKAGWFSR
jgi:hypothetical protein